MNEFERELTEVRPDLFRLVVRVAPPEFGVVIWVRRHAEQVEAVKLVEDFQANPVSCFACFRVYDLKGIGGLLQLREVFHGNHLIGNYVLLVTEPWVSIVWVYKEGKQ